MTELTVGELIILAFLIALAVGSTILVVAACVVAGRDDRRMERPQ